MPGILALPAELQILVADHIDRHDLLAFRLASRELAAASEERFLEAFFSHRKHLLTKHSLETLVAITTSRRTRCAIRSLNILVPQLSELYRPEHFWFCDSHDERKVYRRFQRRPGVWKSWLNLAETLTRDGCGTLLLMRSLRQLSATGLSLTMYPQSRVESGDNSIYGQKHLEVSLGPEWAGDYGFPRAIGPLVHYDIAMSMLLESMVASGIQPTSLSIWGYEDGIPEYERNLPAATILVPELRHSLSQLTHLKLGSTGNFLSLPDVWHDVFLAAMETASPPIRRLDISVPTDDHAPGQIAWFSALLKSTRPERVELTVWCNEGALPHHTLFVELLQHQCATLSRPVINGMREILEEDEITELLVWIGNNMNLQSCTLAEFDGKYISMEGSETVKNTLNQVAKDGYHLGWDSESDEDE